MDFTICIFQNKKACFIFFQKKMDWDKEVGMSAGGSRSLVLVTEGDNCPHIHSLILLFGNWTPWVLAGHDAIQGERVFFSLFCPRCGSKSTHFQNDKLLFCTLTFPLPAGWACDYSGRICLWPRDGSHMLRMAKLSPSSIPGWFYEAEMLIHPRLPTYLCSVMRMKHNIYLI